MLPVFLKSFCAFDFDLNCGVWDANALGFVFVCVCVCFNQYMLYLLHAAPGAVPVLRMHCGASLDRFASVSHTLAVSIPLVARPEKL